MPINKALYPKNWPEISRHIRIDRAKNCCEWCHVPNGLMRLNRTKNRWYRVILTVAHLDRNPANNDESNLAALCQRCHLNYDRPVNVITRKKNRLNRHRLHLIEAGQLELLALNVF